MSTKTNCRSLHQISTIVAGCLALTVFVACHSTNYVRSDATAWRLGATAADIRAVSTNIYWTMSTLNDLLNNQSGDLRLQYARFSGGLNELISSRNRADGEADGLQRRSAAYFAAWDKELQTMNEGEIRQTSSARRTEVMGQDHTAIRRYISSQESLTPVIAYLEDIRKALSTDLTLGGLRAVKVAANKASERAAVARNELEQSATELEALSAAMSSYVPAATK